MSGVGGGILVDPLRENLAQFAHQLFEKLNVFRTSVLLRMRLVRMKLTLW